MCPIHLYCVIHNVYHYRRWFYIRQQEFLAQLNTPKPQQSLPTTLPASSNESDSTNVPDREKGKESTISCPVSNEPIVTSELVSDTKGAVSALTEEAATDPVLGMSSVPNDISSNEPAATSDAVINEVDAVLNENKEGSMPVSDTMATPSIPVSETIATPNMPCAEPSDASYSVVLPKDTESDLVPGTSEQTIDDKSNEEHMETSSIPDPSHECMETSTIPNEPATVSELRERRAPASSVAPELTQVTCTGSSPVLESGPDSRFPLGFERAWRVFVMF